MSLGESQLDVEAIVTRQRILLKSIPRGMAKVLFTARDFGNFLAHPFMKQAAATAVKVLHLRHCSLAESDCCLQLILHLYLPCPALQLLCLALGPQQPHQQ